MNSLPLSPNRLIHEKSPYLLQHAYNPVDWYPWGEEAFLKAKELNKSIFLSIGYSTCHWCHVMAHESFEDVETAELMNKHFINIKIDREERPDVDAIYMAAVQALTGSGGWPMSVWLTPELKPFYAGTYFPPSDRYGRPGFKTVIEQLAMAYINNKDQVVEASSSIVESIQESSKYNLNQSNELPSFEVASLKAFESLKKLFDSVNGGFGKAPKFPMPVYLNFLLNYHEITQDPTALHMVQVTMEKMGEGGLYDQLGGGFARYSTDERWVVPHFEKMLYDNAQLIGVCSHLYKVTGDAKWTRITDESIGYCLRDLQHSQGGFFSGEDADSEGQEGTFYLWTLAQLSNLLPEQKAEIFIFHFGLSVNGNFMDPHSGELGKNILVLGQSLEETAQRFNKSKDEISTVLTECKNILFKERLKRIRPHRDEKVITEWNGLLISSLSVAGQVFSNKSYIDSAERTARFILENLYDGEKKELYRRWKDGERKILGQQVDYAMLVEGLLNLFESTGNQEWLTWAMDLHEKQNQLFFDPINGGYFMNTSLPDLIVRMKDDTDNVIPSGNSVAVRNGLRLGYLTGNQKWVEMGEKTLHAFSKIIDIHPLGLSYALQGLLLIQKNPGHIVVIGEKSQSKFQELLKTVFKFRKPGIMVLPIENGTFLNKLAKIIPFVESLEISEEKSVVYVCANGQCQKPTSEVEELKKQLL
ncbi:MAG: thioredoxin domain-containing protein [Elusimicrobiota bacterium]